MYIRMSFTIRQVFPLMQVWRWELQPPVHVHWYV